MVQGFLWLDELHPAAELGANGGIVAKFIYADKANVPSVMYKNGYEYRIISDHLGSVRMVVDNNSGAILQQLDYDPYGRVIVDTNPGFQPFGYAGGLYDRDTGLVRFGRRDYDPAVGRWTSKDPIGFAGGLNLYGYVVQDPVNLVDPEGESPAAFVLRITRKRWKHIFEGHARAQAGKTTFKTANPTRICKDIKKVVEKPDRTLTQYDGRLLFEKDLGRTVGAKGETIQRVVTEADGTVVTTFPLPGYSIPGSQLGVSLFGNNILGQGIDFFNPLADIQFVADVLTGSEEEE